MTIPRTTMLARRLDSSSVHAFIVNPAEGILAVRLLGKAAVWTLPGGPLAFVEDPEAGLWRLVDAQLEMTPAHASRVLRLRDDTDGTRTRTIYFLETREPRFDFHLHDAAAVAYQRAAALRSLLWADDFQDVIRQFLDEDWKELFGQGPQ